MTYVCRLSLNEERAPFEPTIWHLPSDSKTVLKQVWFPGTHSSVGGNDTDHDLSNIALVWMIQQVHDNTELVVDEHYLDTSKVIAVTLKKPWGCADYESSDSGVWKIAGTQARTPNHYGSDTKESVHQCVEARTDFNKGNPNPWTCPDITGMSSDLLGELEVNMKNKYPVE